jgi:opacity protein-like surface antigen
MKHLSFPALVLAAAAIAFASPASAQNRYVAVSGGVAFLQNSDNKGEFSSPFTTGAGTTIPAGVTLPAGSSLGWKTEFDSGYTLSAAAGWRFSPNLRAELELAYQANDIKTHKGVQAAGIPLGAEDAGVLITGSPNLGVSVGGLVDDGKGGVDTTYLMANAFYDFNQMGRFRPYVGAGLGLGMVNVDYSPSGVEIVDDDKTVFAYQLIAGSDFAVSDRMAIFAQYRYRATSDVDVDVSLFDASLDIENRSSALEVGLRFAF